MSLSKYINLAESTILDQNSIEKKFSTSSKSNMYAQIYAQELKIGNSKNQTTFYDEYITYGNKDKRFVLGDTMKEEIISDPTLSHHNQQNSEDISSSPTPPTILIEPAYQKHEWIEQDKLCGSAYPTGQHMPTILKCAKLMANILSDRFSGKSITLICQGSSGATYAALVYSFLPRQIIEICHVRKEHEAAHYMDCTKKSLSEINIIIDDFVHTGNTIERCFNGFMEYNYAEDIHAAIFCGYISDHNEILNLDINTIICQKYYGTNHRQ